jgi:hypothetical protein
LKKRDFFALICAAVLIALVIVAGYVMFESPTHPGMLTDLSARKRN